MRWSAYLALTALVVCAVTLPLHAGPFPERWDMVGGDLKDDAGADKAVATIKLSGEAHCTHVLWGEWNNARQQEMPPEYFQRLAKVKAAAKAAGVQLVPGVFNIGYSIRYLRFDGNLLSGMPVVDMPFVVKGKTATADPAAVPPLVNGDLEQFADGHFTGWKGGATADTEIKHGGKSSFRITNGPGISQTLPVKPFQYYKLTFWLKRQGKVGSQEIVTVCAQGRMALNRTEHDLPASDDWQLYTTTFNTLEADQVTLVLGPREKFDGTVWYDDVKLEPAGLLWVLRRDLCPLKVTSADGATTYEEGKDFKAISDPAISKKPFWVDASLYDPPVPIELTDGSRIKDGDKLLVSFYHGMRVGTDQFIISIQDPKVFEWMENELKHTIEQYGDAAFFMGYDEIRNGGWEVQPAGQNKTPGELLAAHVKKAVAMIRQRAPKATIYTWSDMFTPHHNAKASGKYYLANGNWGGSWEGLPADVVIMNWAASNSAAMKFFGDRGHKQVLAGYYDAATEDGMKKNIAKWMSVSKDVPGIQGFMYTTWSDNFINLKPYFNLVDTYDQWSAPASSPASAPAK